MNGLFVFGIYELEDEPQIVPQSKQGREWKDKTKAYPVVGESMPTISVLRQNRASVYQDVQGLVCPISQGQVAQSASAL